VALDGTVLSRGRAALLLHLFFENQNRKNI
jgi:hypothetical protein